MEPSYLTVEQVYNACLENKYLLFSSKDGLRVAVNAKVAKLAFKSHPYPLTDLTSWVSFKPCDFNEYITHKVRYI